MEKDKEKMERGKYLYHAKEKAKEVERRWTQIILAIVFI